MNKTSIGVLALVVGMIIGGMLAGVTMNNGALGGVTISDETFVGDVTVQGTVTGADIAITDDLTVTDDVTINGGVVDITSANTATSSVTVGCIDGYATSTATAVKFVLGKAGSSATTTFYNTSSGAVYWAYGSCN